MSDKRLPPWWDTFIRNVCELPGRFSPEDEPSAMVANADELESAAMNAIGEGEPDRFAELEEEVERLEWMLNFCAGKDAGLVNAAAWAWRKHQESGEAS